MSRVWKQSSKFPIYEISNYGEIRNLKTKHILIPTVNKWGYLYVTPCCEGVKKTARVHILVAMEFLPPKPIGHEINHKDGNKENNWADNLEWITRSGNIKHAIKMGLFAPNITGLLAYPRPCGESKSQAKLTWNKIKSIRESQLNNIELAKKFKVSDSLICMVRKNKRWIQKEE